MSLTHAHHLFAGVEEKAFNALIHATFTARPRYLHVGTPPFVFADSLTSTLGPPISFPGIPGGIPYDVVFDIPELDLFPPDPVPEPLPPGANQFSLATTVRLTVGCLRQSAQPDRKPPIDPETVMLSVAARGHVTVTSSTSTSGWIGLALDDVDINIEPEGLRRVVDCIVRMVLGAMLANVRIPFHALNVGAFALSLTEGPEIAADQVEVFGEV